jgi:type I restriction enzyme S subunit
VTEEPYKLPEGWRWVRLGEVCEVWDALRKPVKKKERRPGDVPYCGANGIIDYVDGHTHVGEFILLAEDGGFYGPGETSAYMMSGRFWANNHVHVLRGKSNYLVNQFLYYWLVICDLRPFLTGTTRPKLTQTAMHSILIPLPPLSEQCRIVERIEELMSRIREAKRLRQESKEEAERLWQSVLSETFPKPGTELPKGWQWVRLGEVCSKPQYGLTQAASQESVGPKFVRITDITSGQINWDTVPYCRIDQRTLEKYRLAEGDLLFARSGSVGAILLIRGKPPYDAVFASYLIRVRVDYSVALPEFVDLFIRSPFGQAQIIPQGAAQKNINAKLIQQLLIPIPPLSEQRRIVEHLQTVQEKIKALKEAQAQTEAELKRLEQAILDKAFRGEL